MANFILAPVNGTGTWKTHLPVSGDKGLQDQRDSRADRRRKEKEPADGPPLGNPNVRRHLLLVYKPRGTLKPSAETSASSEQRRGNTAGLQSSLQLLGATL